MGVIWWYGLYSLAVVSAVIAAMLVGLPTGRVAQLGVYAVSAGANGKGTNVELEDVAYTSDYHGGINEVDGSSVDVIEEADREPKDVVPEGCPESPVEAAAGER